MKFVYITSVLKFLPVVLSLQRPFDNTSYRCDKGFYTVKYTHTYIGCVSFCWFSKRCKAVTWDRTSRDCRLHDSTLTDPSQVITDPECISEDVHSSNMDPGHPCTGRPCPDTHVCAPAEAASSHLCLPIHALAAPTTTATTKTATAVTAVTTPDTTALAVPTTTATTATTTSVTTPDTSSTALAAPTTTATTKTEDVSTTSAISTATTATTTSVTTPDTSCYVYMGCYLDDGARMINDVHDRNNSMTHEWCLTRCRQGNYVLAGLEHYDECLCGNSYNNARYTVQNERDCNTPCEGNTNQTCGGPYRLTLYRCI